ncbi:MAG: segregation/condensation protein A [Candidatus Sungbacteria bacterium]|uniref:Segregation and condensation protein A n=1 Tax=Candidatus Sungiibacteriota bacterium TaxID=2750080 RepID=A0A9D6LRF3_9BACT|nr:segregation/condensation protein A [Candidatus Sungbacteria bacterium]
MKSTHYVKQAGFEGPLELLLDLIVKEQLPINEISLARVTEEYVARVKDMESIDQEALAEFLVIAAQLMLIKSRSLLPQLELSKEEAESIGDLERRLKAYAELKERAKDLKTLERNERHIFSREAFLGIPVIFYPPARLTADVLSGLFEGVIRSIPKMQELAEEKIKKVISLEEKIRQIHHLLTSKLERAFSEIVAGSREKIDVIVSFLAILELAKQKVISLHQAEGFEDIIIRQNVESA